MTTITGTAVYSGTHRRYEINMLDEAIFVYNVRKPATHIVAADGMVWWFSEPRPKVPLRPSPRPIAWLGSARSSSPRSSEDDAGPRREFDGGAFDRPLGLGPGSLCWLGMMGSDVRGVHADVWVLC